VYIIGKMIPVQTVPEMGEDEIKENVEGVNSSMIYLIYCKNFCKCCEVPPPAQFFKYGIYTQWSTTQL
jgi:hypothetical protein